MQFQKILQALSFNDLRDIIKLANEELASRENNYQLIVLERDKEEINSEYYDRFYPILGYESYKINRKGQILGKKGNIMQTHKVSKGENYQKVKLTDADGKSMNKFLHRLVALNFIPNLENKKIVNHIDNQKDNNHILNLEWATESENMKHSYIINNSKRHF